MKLTTFIKLSFFKKDYKALADYILRNRYSFNKDFSEKQISIMTNYGLETQNVLLLRYLFEYMSEEDKIRTGKALAGDLLPLVLKQDNYFKLIFSRYSEYFIDTLIENEDWKFILELIEYDKGYMLCKESRQKITEFLLSRNYILDLDYLIKLSCLSDNHDLIDMILSYEYSEYMPLIKKYDATSKKLLLSIIKKIKPENIKEFIYNFSKIPWLLKETYDYVVNNYDGEEQNSYLFELIDFCPNPYFDKNDIVSTILENIIRNDISTDANIKSTEKLMSNLTEAEQNEKCLKALEEKNKKMIILLTATTDCVATYKLVDYILELKSIAAYGYLIQSLKGRFSTYAMDKIIKENDIDVVRQLLNQLYLFNAIGFIILIKFIVEYKYISLFSEEEQSFIMENFAEKEDLALSLEL